MDVLLLHDPRELPVDLFGAISEAGHRVASHGGDAAALEEFLDAMRWTPEAYVVDYRGRFERASALTARLAASPRTRGARLVLAHAPPRAAEAAAASGATGAQAAADAPSVLAALGTGP